MGLRTCAVPELASVPAVLPDELPFFFAGPTRTLIAHDVGHALEGRVAERERLLRDAEAMLAGPEHADRVLVGAVPFASDADVCLFSPAHVTRLGRWWVDDTSCMTARKPRARAHAQTLADDGESFKRSVRRAVAAIERGELRKVVLARTRDVPLAPAPELGRLLHELRVRNDHGFIFALRLPTLTSPARTLVGASPELLLSRRGDRVLSAPLAGSTPRSHEPNEDLRRAERLLCSAKDRHEHAIVVEQVVESMRPFVRDLRVDRAPSLVETPTLFHLASRVEGRLCDRDVSSLRVALSLHPTPAVCGTPARVAAAFIAREEPFDRGYFTGALGHMDASGDGDWIVTIRCAELARQGVRVFAGAGIVATSDPEAELAETEVKMQTMLDALGVGVRP